MCTQTSGMQWQHNYYLWNYDCRRKNRRFMMEQLSFLLLQAHWNSFNLEVLEYLWNHTYTKSPKRMKKYRNGDRTVIEMAVKEASCCNVLWEQVKFQFSRSCAKKGGLCCRYEKLQLFKVTFFKIFRTVTIHNTVSDYFTASRVLHHVTQNLDSF